MNKYGRIFAALLLSSASASLAACGDSNDSEEKDSGTDAGHEHDAGTEEDSGKADSGKDDAGTEQDAGGGGGLAKCPDDSHIEDDNKNKVCIITAPGDDPLVDDVTLAPVDGYLGYVLQGVVYVGEDVGGDTKPDSSKKTATLKIKAGTMLAGADDKSGLAINRGSKIEAIGTKTDPVVFTSANAMFGDADPRPTDWGGIVLMGRATQNRGANPKTELGTGEYGGPDDEDSSGTMKYVRVEYTGSRSDPEHEFNAVSFYAVGSGTTIDYLQSHAGSDDSFEFFGGTVQAKHLVSSGAGDDNFDWTDGFRGKVQFAVALQCDNFGDNGIEADNQSGKEDATPVSEPTFSNLTMIGNLTANGDAKNGMRLRVGTGGHFYSTLIMNFATSCVEVKDSSVDLIGDKLTMESTRIWCDTMYAAEGKKLFDTDSSNEELDSKDDVLKDPFELSDKVDFTPVSGSDLLGAGTVPDDEFFEKVDYIGAFGEDNWLEGWTSFAAFEPK